MEFVYLLFIVCQFVFTIALILSLRLSVASMLELFYYNFSSWQNVLSFRTTTTFAYRQPEQLPTLHA